MGYTEQVKAVLYVKDIAAAENLYRSLVEDERILAGSVTLPGRPQVASPWQTLELHWVKGASD